MSFFNFATFYEGLVTLKWIDGDVNMVGIESHKNVNLRDTARTLNCCQLKLVCFLSKYFFVYLSIWSSVGSLFEEHYLEIIQCVSDKT